MEHILALYHRPYDALQPVVCMDELSFQLLDHYLAPVPMKPEQIARQDYEYEHKGTINLLAAFQPLAGRRITWECPTRRAWDFAYFCKHLADECYPQATCIHLVVDNRRAAPLNTHHPSSFYRSFAPEEAFRLANRFVFHYTPKHASWLNMIEIEFAAITKLCFKRRIADQRSFSRQVQAIVQERNHHQQTVNWQFSVNQARKTFNQADAELK